jgi:hypothetical protein
MVEFLQKLLKDIATAKLLPDADMAFLVNLENAVISEAKKPVDNMRQQGILPPAQQSPGQPMGAGGGGVMQGPPMPSPDEMQRMLAPGQGPQ